MPSQDAKLASYGGRMIETDGRRPTVELRDPNDNARKIFQYRREGEGAERRLLAYDGSLISDWEPLDVRGLQAVRGKYHPILDPLGIGPIEDMSGSRSEDGR